MTTSSRLPGVGAILMAALLWGTTGTVQTFLPEDRDPLAVGALRLLVGASTLLLIALARPESRRAFARLPWGGILLAGLAIGGYNLLFFRAVTETGVGIGTAIAIGSAPLWATAFEVIVNRERPAGLRLLGQGVAILGVGFLALAGGGQAGSLLGVALAAGAAACYATYSMVTSQVGHRAPPATTAAATFGVAALMTSPVLAVAPLGWMASPQGWMWIGFLGVGVTGLSYALYTWGLTRVAASTAVTLALAEPVTAWLLASAVVGETVTGQKVLGALLVLAGLALITLLPARRSLPASPAMETCRANRAARP
ncbi:Permease of the drug/metabolite transporter (DMT) superfamily [Rubellimicrobium mesophilum DSM 19309]|uniref:Permease of the drug/metabolite transporter (DMT) superfamily n=1 Tax=Rubellimicrobium mesophilum DSM 19309 TaxID=442562 RepID=A0A017HT20_9RHOB|nr:DMT family transporter [Rubellimicrobium mesophilum]EYD76904.1 Permease of the drug/metabolite transporter (DMT) superfamily [Rubellimicrobium mesophilum DSM 19309]